MYELKIDCMDCGKTVHGQDWLSGGMCANCNAAYDRKVAEVQAQHKIRNEERLNNDKKI